MTNSQLTQCPHCKASFKVSDEQLNAANGKVRCGACLNIFDAIAYQISSQADTKQNENDPNENIDASILEDDLDFNFDFDEAIDLERELLESLKSEEDSLALNDDAASAFTDDNLSIFTDDDTSTFTDDDTSTFTDDDASAFTDDDASAFTDDDVSVFADDPEEDKQEKGYAGSTKFGDELSTSFLELEKPGNDKFKKQFLKDEPLEDSDEDGVDESWTSSILDDLEDPKDHRAEPSISSNEDIEEIETEEALTEIKPTPQAKNEQFSQKDLNALNFEYEQDSKPKNKWIIGTFLFLINFSLLLVLLAQASWFHYEKLAKYPKVSELFVLACQKLHCELPTLSNISKIENRNLVVRSHPTTFNALIIETIITNHAPFEQAFPKISLSFSNINNQVIAQRLFEPSEYLNAETLNWPGMPSEQPIQITLEIIDPGPEAVNYKINFHSAIDQ